MGRGFGDGMGGSAAWAAACIPQRARVLTLKREVDVVVPATLTMPREPAPDARPRGTATEAQVRLEKAEIEPVILAPSSLAL